jgi:PAS domain S-box-containing protein
MRAERCGIDPSAILDAASESIIVTGSDLEQPGPIIVYVNPAFERMTGWMAAEIIGKSPRLLQGAKTDHSVFETMRDALRRGDRWEGQAVNYRRDGSEFMMEWSITPLKHASGRTTHFVAVQRDVTARVEAERRIADAREAAREADRKKANLARYFSPKMVEVLAQADQPLGRVRRQRIAIMFIDIVGFTAISEMLAPERVVALVRSFYRRMSKAIFAHGGSIEKFAGDALMALFGVPEPGRCDATSALSAALGMMDELDRWNAKRIRSGREPIEAGISVHFGTAVLGDIGTRESMTFTAIGDSVNTASRMQALCRELKRRLVVSQPLVDRVRRESCGDDTALAYLCYAGGHGLRGRRQKIQVWTESAEQAGVGDAGCRPVEC